MLDAPRFDRRTYVADVGTGTFALAVLTLAASGPGSAPSAGSSLAGGPSPAGDEPSAGRSQAGAGSGAATGASAAAGSSSPPGSGPGGALAWSRVNLGFVSAYILARGGEAAVVDTGLAGSEAAIEAALTAAGLSWASVAHLVLTHRHPDHVGSARAVLDRAAGAVAYAGAEDIPAIAVPRPLKAVRDGDTVFGLRVVAAPGHTAGSICVLDTTAGVLVAGDALRTDGGRPILPNPQPTEDMDMARASVAKLGKLTFETLLVGHGDPIRTRASDAVAALARG